jgi:hypothetical protein
VGKREGANIGFALLGYIVGETEIVGLSDGALVGLTVGVLGATVGLTVGELDGANEGANDGEGGGSGDLLVGGLGLEAAEELTCSYGETGADIGQRDDTYVAEFRDTECGERDRRVALLVGIIFFEGSVAEGALVPKSGRSGCDFPEDIAVFAVGCKAGGRVQSVAGLLEDDGWKIAVFVMPPVAVAGAVERGAGITADLREDTRENAGGGFREEFVGRVQRK